MGYRDEIKYIEEVVNMLTSLRTSAYINAKKYDFAQLDRNINFIFNTRRRWEEYYIKGNYPAEIGEKLIEANWESDKESFELFTSPKIAGEIIENLKKADDEAVKDETWQKLYGFFLYAGTFSKGHEVEKRKAEYDYAKNSLNFINKSQKNAVADWNKKVLAVAEKANLDISTLDETERNNSKRIEEINSRQETLNKSRLLLKADIELLTKEKNYYTQISNALSKETITEDVKEQLNAYALDIEEMENMQKNLIPEQKQNIEKVQKFLQAGGKAEVENNDASVKMPDEKEFEELNKKPEVKAYLKAENARKALKDFGVNSIGDNLSLADYKNYALDLASLDKDAIDSTLKIVGEKLVSQNTELDKNIQEQQRLSAEMKSVEAKAEDIAQLKSTMEDFELHHGENLNQREKLLKDVNLEPVYVEDDLIEQAKLMYSQRDFKKGSHINTKEFKNMMNSLKMVTEWKNEKVINEIRAKNNQKPESLEEAMEILGTATNAYIIAKRNQTRNNPSSLRTSRLALADNILSFAQKGKKLAEYAKEINNGIEEIRQVKEQKVELKGRVAEKAEPEKEIAAGKEK